MWLWWWATVALILLVFLPVGYRGRGRSERPLYPSYLQRRRSGGPNATIPPDPLGLDAPPTRAGTAMHAPARHSARTTVDAPHRNRTGDLFWLAIVGALAWALILWLA